jgi:rsbT co-antagonist protein RsbR
MADTRWTEIGDVLRRNIDDVLAQWVERQRGDLSLRNNMFKAGELEQQSREFLTALVSALEAGRGSDVLTAEAWSGVRDLLASLSRTRARQGFTPIETATFVFSLKQPLFDLLQRQGVDITQNFWTIMQTLDALGLYTTESYQKGREEIIARQQQELMELSTPVVELWHGVLALPLIGTLDSARTQVVMESLLQAIVDTGSSIAIIDITGVPVVDTLVAQHLLKTVAAARLMGADCIISGIRPQIAQTIVHLGVEINDVITKATLADAFAVALTRLGLAVGRRRGDARPAVQG